MKIGLDLLQASLLGRRRSTGLPGPSVLLRSSLSSGIDCVWCFPPLSRTSRVGFRCLGSASQSRKPPRHHFNHDDPHDLPRRLRYYLASPHLTHRVPSTYLGIVLVEVDILRRRSSAFKSRSACFLLKCRTWRDCCTARTISVHGPSIPTLLEISRIAGNCAVSSGLAPRPPLLYRSAFALLVLGLEH